jgi:hypothetical protein
MTKTKELRMSDGFYDQIQILRYVLEDMRRADSQPCSLAIARTMCNSIRLDAEAMLAKLGGVKKS